MGPAQKAFNIVLVASLFAAAALVRPSLTGAAGGPQTCTIGETCTMGEFLFNDEYAPLAGADCEITTRDPSGNLIHNELDMTEGSGAWYYYQFATPSTSGYYRSQVCCTSGTDYLCIDKSFEAKSPPTSLTTSSIASAVWGYSSRTLSGFGNLISDIWSNI